MELYLVESAFSPDGKLFAIGSALELKVWDVTTGQKVQTIKKLEGGTLAIAFSPDSRTIALSSGKISPLDRQTIQDSQINIWDVSTAKLIRNLRGKNDTVASFHFADNGNALLFGTLQYEAERTVGTVKVWDFLSNRLATFNVHEGQKVLSLNLLPGKSEVVLQSGADVEIRDTRTWRVKQSFEANRDDSPPRGATRFVLSVKQVVAIGFLPDGVTVSGLIPEEGLRLWDSRTGARKSNQGIKPADGLIARSANGKVLGAVNAQEIKLWDLSTGSHRVLNLSSAAPVSAFALSYDASLMAVAEDSQIKLRNSDENSVRSLKGHESTIEHMAFSNDGRMLVSADESGAIKVWEVKTGQLRQSISNGNLVTALAVDPTGQLLASAGSDYLISVWNATTGALQVKLKKHENVVNALTFSPDGKSLASGGDDRVAVLWDVVAGKSKQTLKGHDLTVTSLAFSADGQLLATGSGNASVVLWNVDNGKLDRVLK
jgi:WD40 repeat protein